MECILAAMILFGAKSIPVTLAPSLASGSQIIPPPQPTSSIFKFLIFLLFNLI